MTTLFTKYMKLREENSPSVSSKIKLQKKEGSKEFAPFTVNRTTHPNLRYLIKAFVDSDKVGVGYTTIDKSKGETEPTLKKKKLYLTGGAARDHLKGKTAKNYDLVTDATVSEIRMILSHPEAGFTEIKPKNEDFKNDERYADLPVSSKGHTFFVKRWDKQGKEVEMTVEINGETFDIAPLFKGSKSRRLSPHSIEMASSVEEDATSRDFTINSLYIPLTSTDGDNSELIDPHGGAHHLKNGEVVAVGSMSQRLKDDPMTSLRYIRMLSRFGNLEKIPEKYKAAITQHKDMDSVPKEDVRKEFLNGLEHPDSDPRKYVQAYHSTGLLNVIFPDVEFDPEKMPEDFVGDRWFAPAWILRNNEPDQVSEMLEAGGWSKNEARDVAYLVKLYQWGEKNNFDSEKFYELKKSHTGLTKSKIREWMQMVKLHGREVDAFLGHDDSDLKGVIQGEDGRRSVNPEFKEKLGRSPQGAEFAGVKRQISTDRFKELLNKLGA